MNVQHLDAKIGDALTIEVERTINESTGQLEDLTGMAVQWLLYYNDRRSQPILTKDESNGVFVTNAAKGSCEIRLRSVDTANLPPDTYYYEVKILDSNQDRFTIAEGTIELYRRKR